MANTLLEQDADKIITQEELENFVKSNDVELEEMNISSADAMNELKDILKDSFQKDSETANTNNEGAEINNNGDPVAQYNQLKAQVEEYKRKLEQYDIQINTLNKDTESLQSELDDAIKTYNNKEAELVRKNSYLEETINDINSTSEDLQSDVVNQQKRTVWNAVNDYDPESDGDWDSYLQKACEGEISSSFSSKLNSLISESKVSAGEIKSIAANLSSLGQNVEQLSDKISANSAELANLNALRATTATALEKAQKDLENSILNFVTCEEMALVTNNGINLKEALPDGSPRYIFAKGKQDGKFHIYDMSNGASLARQYGCDGGGLKGQDIVPMGNGYITMHDGANGDMLGEAGGEPEEIFWLTDCGMQSKCASYCTSSPLEFDLEGDGHKVDTSKTVKFDIDGDGKLDNINDSLDAVLVFDKDGDGISGEDGSETFGDNTDLDNKNGKDGYKNGFEALKALRDKAIKEGVITDRGDGKLNADDLAALEKNYGLKIKTGGYNSDAKSLADVGITEINISDSKVSDKTQFDEFGNEVQTQDGATFKINGQENTYVDMWHRKYSDDEVKNYDSIKGGSSLSFDYNKAGQNAINTKLNVQTRMSNIFAQSNSNSNTADITSLKAKSNANKVLDEKFWKNTSEPVNFFTQNNNETDEVKEAEELKEKEIEEEKEKEEK